MKTRAYAGAGVKKKVRGDRSSEVYLAALEEFQSWCAAREIPFRYGAARAFQEFMAARTRRRRGG